MNLTSRDTIITSLEALGFSVVFNQVTYDFYEIGYDGTRITKVKADDLMAFAVGFIRGLEHAERRIGQIIQQPA